MWPVSVGIAPHSRLDRRHHVPTRRRGEPEPSNAYKWAKENCKVRRARGLVISALRACWIYKGWYPQLTSRHWTIMRGLRNKQTAEPMRIAGRADGARRRSQAQAATESAHLAGQTGASVRVGTAPLCRPSHSPEGPVRPPGDTLRLLDKLLPEAPHERPAPARHLGVRPCSSSRRGARRGPCHGHAGRFSSSWVIRKASIA